MLAEVDALVEEAFFDFGYVVDAGNGDDSELSEVGVDDDGLCVGVGDDAYAALALEVGKVSLEFGPEVRVFDIVDLAGEVNFLTVVGRHARAAGAEVGVVVHPVEELVGARFVFFNYTKKTTHIPV